MAEQARVEIHNAGMMTPADRQAIADWLVVQASELVVDGKDYDTTYVGRYAPKETKKNSRQKSLF